MQTTSITYQNNRFGQYLTSKNSVQKVRTNYIYGFQAQERDDQVKGRGKSYNFEYRMHDSRLGRFFAVDPLAFEFPHNSPYAFSENRVLDAFELEGLEKVQIGGHWYDFTGKSESYVRGTLNMLEKYHQGHLTYERISNWQKHWRATVKNETNYWGRSSGTTISIYSTKDNYNNDNPFYLQTERDISQKLVNTLEPGDGQGEADPALAGGWGGSKEREIKGGTAALSIILSPFTIAGGGVYIIVGSVGLLNGADDMLGAINNINNESLLQSLSSDPNYKNLVGNLKTGATFVTAIGGGVQMWKQGVDLPSVISEANDMQSLVKDFLQRTEQKEESKSGN